ncbi:uncharacterized protein I206_102724 [Kwoniella pini CBS 10737]|uniref:Uncharacterized protein n=1 Tax=Kwoniella pini CBS 10737 TaxID=1296096 RepID=A0A1B9I667_9TREE|nr:uncharacterized protein I206_03078 [Kwoniella pini CBS 10737]OCF51014.1 hypothetical protein I206_03078 [Kwoniella pini CBS 10737]
MKADEKDNVRSMVLSTMQARGDTTFTEDSLKRGNVKENQSGARAERMVIEFNKRQNQGSSKPIPIETQRVEVDDGGSLPTHPLRDPTGGKGQLKLSMMWETINELETSVGKMTEKCLIPAEDTSQKFCEILLDGEILGGANDSIASSFFGTPTIESIPTTFATEAGIISSTPQASATPSNRTIVPDTVSTSSIQTTALSSGSVTDFTPSTLDDSTESATATATSASQSNSGSLTDTSTIAITTTSAQNSVIINFTVQPLTSNSATTTADAAAASQDATTVSIPGQKLQVLPIGLGVFGGLAGIAILVILYVTYQRRKFKLQFRSRKLAEKASPMGISENYGLA